MNQTEIAQLNELIQHLTARFDLLERHVLATIRSIDHVTRSLDNLWIQHEKHGQVLSELDQTTSNLRHSHGA